VGRSSPLASPLTVRLATLDDAEAIRAIYNREVTGSTVTFDLVPRTLAEQRAWLRAHSGAPYRERPAYATTVEDSVYVRHDARRQGVGAAVLAELVRLATAHGFHAMMARVVGGHEASIQVHRACGFELVGVEREVGRKLGRWLDVVVMERLL
jgi:phosphinothricin acetyltransferase